LDDKIEKEKSDLQTDRYPDDISSLSNLTARELIIEKD